MAINLLDVKPHVVSRDLSGYITFIYGAPKTGKTTMATQMPGSLLLAFEKGYNAIPGVYAQDVNTWGEMKQICRELKKPEVKAVYKSIIVDTVDIAADLCQRYICNQLGIENIGDGGWTTNGWAKYKKEFEEVFRGLTMLGYAVFFISHEGDKTSKVKGTNEEYTQITPTVQSSALKIIENMADIYGYVHNAIDPADGTKKVMMKLRSDDDSVRCGCRFKEIEPEIVFSYDNLVDKITKAIDEEAKLTDNKFVTDERMVVKEEVVYDYDALMAEFKSLVEKLMQANQSNASKITAIVDKYLGKGKKVGDTTPAQAEIISLIVEEIKSDLINS